MMNDRLSMTDAVARFKKVRPAQEFDSALSGLQKYMKMYKKFYERKEVNRGNRSRYCTL